jgi:hypothetical protein
MLRIEWIAQPFVHQRNVKAIQLPDRYLKRYVLVFFSASVRELQLAGTGKIEMP